MTSSDREQAPNVQEQGPAGTALSTSVRANGTAFGFSISITVSFGVLQRLDGQPTLFELLLFGLAAALAVGLLEGAVTRGFRRRVGVAPPEVSMLGTALNVISVAAGVGAAMLTGTVLGGVAAWGVAGFASAFTYVIAESMEVLFGIWVQRERGDPDADSEQG